jgi:hypothetical protein
MNAVCLEFIVYKVVAMVGRRDYKYVCKRMQRRIKAWV